MYFKKHFCNSKLFLKKKPKKRNKTECIGQLFNERTSESLTNQSANQPTNKLSIQSNNGQTDNQKT